ncbi:intraflagellar transport-associated protein [Dendrobates tinctorius]|uniref:intraflagellar transport-associated protein n=1 Tax=Dendrobates tinctorius TaxID=92724 RepID=UPI003CC9A058
MPSSEGTPPLDVSDDEMVNNVLSRFINVPEQTYEEFLSTFTRLPPGAGRQQPEVLLDGSQMMNTGSLKTRQRTRDKTGAASGQDGPQQMAVGEGTTVGDCHSRSHPGREQVDNYFNSSDIDTDPDNDETGRGVLLFPGEADRVPDGANVTIVRNTCIQIHTSSGVESTAEEHLGDDIQPFCLDQSFDYDRVVLTSKVSAEEMNFLRLREAQVETAREA